MRVSVFGILDFLRGLCYEFWVRGLGCVGMARVGESHTVEEVCLVSERGL